MYDVCKKGSLEPGKDADIAVFDDDFSAWRTMIGGDWIEAGEDAPVSVPL